MHLLVESFSWQWNEPPFPQKKTGLLWKVHTSWCRFCFTFCSSPSTLFCDGHMRSQQWVAGCSDIIFVCPHDWLEHLWKSIFPIDRRKRTDWSKLACTVRTKEKLANISGTDSTYRNRYQLKVTKEKKKRKKKTDPIFAMLHKNKFGSKF